MLFSPGIATAGNKKPQNRQPCLRADDLRLFDHVMTQNKMMPR